MGRMQVKRIAKIALSVLLLTLAAVLLAVPAYAEGSETANAAPFWFTPIGMTAIILAVAVLVVALVYLVRAQRAQRKDDEPTVIPLNPNLPEMRTQEDEPKTFAEAVDRYAKEEEEKAAAEQKRELNRAINEVLYDIRLADLREQRAQAQSRADVHPGAAQPAQTAKTADGETVAASCGETAPVIAEDDDVARELADRVEQRADRRTDADSIREADEKSVKKAAYYAAFEEAKNISADASDAIDLTEEDISPAVTAELEEELEKSEQPLETGKADNAEIDAVIADIRDSVLSEGEKPIELTEEDEEAAEEAIAEEPAAAAYADLTEEEPEEPEEDDEEEDSDEEDSEDDENAEDSGAGEAPAMLGGQRIVYIDAKANPEAYAELLEREKRGEVTLVYRYRKSFLAKMALAEDTVKGYYNELKNALLAYKGVKCRTSWGYEAFNKGRSWRAWTSRPSRSTFTLRLTRSRLLTRSTTSRICPRRRSTPQRLC